MKKEREQWQSSEMKFTLFKRHYSWNIENQCCEIWHAELSLQVAADPTPLRSSAQVTVGLAERSWKKNKVFNPVTQQSWSTVICQVTELGLGAGRGSDTGALHGNYGLDLQLGELCSHCTKNKQATGAGRNPEWLLCLQRKPSSLFT